MLKKYKCTFPYCDRYFDSQKALLLHENKDARHNPNLTYSNKFIGGNKRHSIPYESSKNVESNKVKKTLGGPQYVDVDILKSMLSPNNSTGSEFDDSYYGLGIDGDLDDEDENDETIIGITETLHNINIQQEREIEEIQHPSHPDLVEKNILAYRHYQNKLYNQVFGVNALEANDIQQFKDLLTDFEPKRLNILKCYLFAKSCNLSRNNGDSLLHLIRTICPSPILSIPDSWSTVTRAINDQCKYYSCQKFTIAFPEHWEMDKWNSRNASCLEKVVI